MKKMTRIQLAANGRTSFEKLIGHNEILLKKWRELEGALRKKTTLEEQLKEQVRRAMAFENGCEYCMVKGGRPDFDVAARRMSVAVAFATLFCQDHQCISNTHFDVLKESFTEKEISELVVFITFTQAAQKLGKVFNLTEEYQTQAVVKLKDVL